MTWRNLVVFRYSLARNPLGLILLSNFSQEVLSIWVPELRKSLSFIKLGGTKDILIEMSVLDGRRGGWSWTRGSHSLREERIVSKCHAGVQ